ncbi:regulatory YrvL family protein [Sporolactobacillus shoreicorticis]|uniref:YrvL family regulatory protein n=1 Tax=Sporolactobacillus shoreicorticis TaxID=1923877 RepID=A0ABW5S032_9BACL|nr:YrvL family regulatory protein [Sporolactobacillus shoreicorticis]MCO7126983.1 regulatory YrvL family protein [Sporolactobacillus shoreicorticis]
MKDDEKRLPIGIKIVIGILIASIIIGALLISFGAIFFGFIGMFNLLGIYYDNFNSLFAFTIFYCALSLFSDIPFKGSIFMINHYKAHLKQTKWVILFLIALSINFILISFLDDQMAGIFISSRTKIVVSAFLAALDLVVDSEKIC